jgi:hypothetical protein
MDHYDEDDAPPPYSAVDPLRQPQPVTNTSSDTVSPVSPPIDTQQPQFQLPLRLRGGETPLPIPTTSTSTSTSDVFSSPVPITSAASYFAERPLPPTSPSPSKRDTLIHHLTVYARSQRKDFPRRPRCWNSRGDEITQHDWDTFLNFLFPPHLAPAASNNRLPRRLRAEIERDRKDRPQETDEEREARIAAVLTEWNEGFFGPRATWISWAYIADLDRGPASPLCPECYPAATQASQNRRHTRSRSEEAPVPVTGTPSQTTAPPLATEGDRSSAIQSEAAISPSHPFMPFGPWGVHHPGGTPAAMPFWGPHFHGHHLHGHAFRGPYMHPQPPSSSASGPLSWASQLSTRAQEYAERVSEQAQQYGKWFEESALMRGQQMEQAGDQFSNWASGIGQRGWPGWPRGDPASNAGYEMSRNVGIQQTQQRHRPRRGSTSSSSSDESLSSIDSLSTVSDLDPADLATVRAQLLSLDSCPPRELHAAAVGLRSHLRIVQQTRRDSRFRTYRGGFGGRRGRGHWGRWESPEEERQREQQRRAMRAEARALRETFRMVERRAREESREPRRGRRGRWSRGGHRHGDGSAVPEQVRSHRIDHGGDPDSHAPSTGSAVRTPNLTPSAAPFNRSRSDLSPNPGPALNPQRSTTSPGPSFTSANPRDAAKARAETQRAKQTVKLAKERRKAIEKSYKEKGKEIRKAARDTSKQAREGHRGGSSDQWTGLRHNASTPSLRAAVTGQTPSASSTSIPTSSSIPDRGNAAQESGIITRSAPEPKE